MQKFSNSRNNDEIKNGSILKKIDGNAHLEIPNLLMTNKKGEKLKMSQEIRPGRYDVLDICFSIVYVIYYTNCQNGIIRMKNMRRIVGLTWK